MPYYWLLMGRTKSIDDSGINLDEHVLEGSDRASNERRIHPKEYFLNSYC
jgi:hypothetical protein